MIVSRLVKLSLRNVSRNRTRNITVFIIVFLAVFLLFVTTGIARYCAGTWRQYFSTTFMGDYQVTSFPEGERDYSAPGLVLPSNLIPRSFVETLEESGFEVSPRLNIGGIIYDYEKQNFERKALPVLIGTDIGKDLSRMPNLIFRDGKWDPEHEEGVLVWKELADFYGWTVGREIDLYIKDVDGNAYPFSFTVDGIMDNTEGADLGAYTSIVAFPIIFVSRTHLSNLLGVDPDTFTEAAVWNGNPELLHGLSREAGFASYTAEKNFSIIRSIVEFISFSGYFLSFFVLLILAIATINLNVMSFLERRREIGTMLAIGFKPLFVNAVLVLEVMFLGFLSFLVPLAVFEAAKALVGPGIYIEGIAVVFAGKPFILMNDVPVALFGLAVITGAMLISVIFPLYLTTQVRPVEIFQESED